MVFKKSKYQEPAFYARLFDRSEEGPFKVLPCRMKNCVIKKRVPVDTNFYVFQERKSACVLCSLSSAFLCFGKKLHQVLDTGLYPRLKKRTGSNLRNILHLPM